MRWTHPLKSKELRFQRNKNGAEGPGLSAFLPGACCDLGQHTRRPHPPRLFRGCFWAPWEATHRKVTLDRAWHCRPAVTPCSSEPDFPSRGLARSRAGGGLPSTGRVRPDWVSRLSTHRASVNVCVDEEALSRWGCCVRDSTTQPSLRGRVCLPVL